MRSLPLAAAACAALALLLALAREGGEARAELATGGRSPSRAPAPARVDDGDRAARPGSLLDSGDTAGDSARTPASPSPVPGTGAKLVVRSSSLQTGRPVPGARLRVSPVDRSSIPEEHRDAAVERRITADETGTARLALLDGIPWSVRADAPLAGAAWLDVAPLTPGEERALDVAVSTERDQPVRFLVLDVADDRPLAGARVRLWWETGEVFANADADGRVALLAPSWSQTWVAAEVPGYVSSTWEVDLPLAGELVVRPARAAGLSVRVRAPSGEPLAGARVEASWTHRVGGATGRVVHESGESTVALTDARGRVELQPLPPGVSVSVSARLSRELAWERVMLSPAEQRELSLELARPARARIEGTLRDAEGRPRRARIGLLSAPEGAGPRHFLGSERWDDTGTSRGDGSFAFESVRPGTWWVGVRPGLREASDLALWADVVTVTEDAEVVRVDFVAPPALAVAGRVVDGRGAGLAIDLRAETPEGELVASTATAEDGAFRLAPLPPGAFRLQAGMESRLGPSLPVLAQAGSEGVVIRLPALEPVRISLGSDAEASEHLFAQAWGEGSAWSARFWAEGEVALGAQPGRKATVLLCAGDAFAAGEIDLSPGAVHRLALRPAARLLVRSAVRAPATAELAVAGHPWRNRELMALGSTVIDAPAGVRSSLGRRGEDAPRPLELVLAPGEVREVALD